MYHYSAEQTLTDLSGKNIDDHYAHGFVFTRLGKGVVQEVRSLRLNLRDFRLTSENRRILKKTEDISCELAGLPYQNYHWSIGKLASDFYTTKFGEGTMSANKVKEMFTDPSKSNLNSVFVYIASNSILSSRESARLAETSQGWVSDRGDLISQAPNEIAPAKSRNDGVLGYCLAYQSKNIVHYAYPFYSLLTTHYSLGISMMTKALVYAKESKRKYAYLGSVQGKRALYKLQFESLEWWDGNTWDTDIRKLKHVITSSL